MKETNLVKLGCGAFLILLGIGFLGDQFNLIAVGEVLKYLWPTAVTLLGVYLLVRARRQLILGLIITLIGVFSLIDTAVDLPFSVWDLWPLVLVAIGINILFNGKFNFNSKNDSRDDKLDSTAVFWGDSRRVLSKNFKGGDISAIFGGSEIDLTNTKFDNGVATINILCLFGGIDIKLPENTVVVNKGLGIFGGFEEKLSSVRDEESSQKLIIEGLALFGGVSVKS